ncbi:hypothetical protein P691DRAFT_711032 [Macrolepiota fuliginosa MF-IS2]|uniref:Transmembrane protein 135 N-terminal domain-containing protein n=1 Tax=Macrolepiota fuliginosa MF-IS2 TaxID=1400762 RepID=A0A9P5X0G6_9AGAR|nr:hypothetical protein P691DRAFT_714773 [Macrolepiota fuliginosa MF-IS2]KAF9445004.1 hypothetical protein P691DRAFT_711032 [Macrolepiota fuliginosa MF-IS2]
MTSVDSSLFTTMAESSVHTDDETPFTTAPPSGTTTPYNHDSSIPPTPGEGIHFTPRRAMASFDNLVALANYQERLKDARRVVWRDKGEPVVDVETLRGCFDHAAKGGFRSGSLAFGIRACVNLVLALLRIHRVPRDYRPALIRHALFGEDTWRFAAMLGTFTSLYKFLINALPILIPALSPSESSTVAIDDDLEAELPTTVMVPTNRRRTRLSLSTRTRLILIRKRTRRWHAALAGAIAGGLAIIWEKRSRRGLIAQQFFVRGLQGSYNSYTTRKGIHVPHGDVLVFALACGQIMYAFLLRPDSLPRSYHVWIGQAGQISPECVRMNQGLVREGKIQLADLNKVLATPDITPVNTADLLAFQRDYLSAQPSTYLPRFVPCSAVHPAVSACSSVPLDRFFAVFKWMLPIYGALHFIPPVVFKWKNFLSDPGAVIVKAGLGSMRSSAFLGVFVVIYQTLFCYKHHFHRYITELKRGIKPSNGANGVLKRIPQFVVDLLVSKMSFMFLGLASGLSLFVEEKRRRAELAMYVLPKGLESFWVTLRGHGLVFKTGKWGEVLLTAIAMAMVMTTYQNDPQHLSGLVRRFLYQFIGPN